MKLLYIKENFKKSFINVMNIQKICSKSDQASLVPTVCHLMTFYAKTKPITNVSFCFTVHTLLHVLCRCMLSSNQSTISIVFDIYFF